MASLWPKYITVVGGFLDSPTEGKTIEQTAEKLASEYHKAVKTALITGPPYGVGVSVQPSYIPMKLAIQRCLQSILDSGGKPQLYHFAEWALKVVEYWTQVTYGIPIPHPAAIAASTGFPPVGVSNVTTVGGVPATLQSDLLTAFTHPPSPIPYGVPMATKLVKAFTTHLTTVAGVHTIVTTSGTPVTPIPLGPVPYPWSGLV